MVITKLTISKAVNKKFSKLDAKSSKEVVDFIFDHITEEVYKSNKVSIDHFLTIYADIKKPRKFHNIATGMMEKIPYQWGILIKISKSFNARIKGKPCYSEDD